MWKIFLFVLVMGTPESPEGQMGIGKSVVSFSSFEACEAERNSEYFRLALADLNKEYYGAHANLESECRHV